MEFKIILSFENYPLYLDAYFYGKIPQWMKLKESKGYV
jgi:hypothetical protein